MARHQRRVRREIERFGDRDGPLVAVFVHGGTGAPPTVTVDPPDTPMTPTTSSFACVSVPVVPELGVVDDPLAPLVLSSGVVVSPDHSST